MESQHPDAERPFACHFLTLFPEFFYSGLGTSILGRAIASRRLAVTSWDIRDFATDRNRITDDTPYGGGAGMVMKVGPLVRAMEAAEQASLQAGHGRPWRVALTPAGKPFDQACARRLAQKGALSLLCGRYEGMDERALERVDEEVSLGDFILTGGEPAALVILDAVSRLVPGVLGNVASAQDESFGQGLLEYPQYTRPLSFRGQEVPQVLRSGDHGRIHRWRRAQALLRTQKRRPDLFARYEMTRADHKALKEFASVGPEITGSQTQQTSPTED